VCIKRGGDSSVDSAEVIVRAGEGDTIRQGNAHLIAVVVCKRCRLYAVARFRFRREGSEPVALPHGNASRLSHACFLVANAKHYCPPLSDELITRCNHLPIRQSQSPRHRTSQTTRPYRR